MRTCNFWSRCLALPIFGMIALFFSPSLYAQILQVQSVQAPTAPTLSVPTITAPAAPTAPVVSTSTTTTTTQNTSSANENDSQTELASSTIPPNLTATALQTLSSFIGAETDTDSLSGLGDLGSISSLGNLGSLSSLLGSTDSGIQTTVNAASTNALLTQIIQKLDTVLASIDTNEVGTRKTAVSEQIIPQDISQILRFSSSEATPNNQNASVYNILNTCRSVFISEPEIDGTFLLTCDRLYGADGAIQNETFYMLFKATKTDTFEVAVSVQQNRENKNSILYRLSEHSPLTAVRTGNLVTLQSQNPAPQVELLLDINFAIN